MISEIYVCVDCLEKKFGLIQLNLDELPKCCSFCSSKEKKGIIIRFRRAENKIVEKAKKSIEIVEVKPETDSLKESDILNIVRIHLRRQKADELIENICFSVAEENYFEK